jgi:hypothetical protein
VSITAGEARERQNIANCEKWDPYAGRYGSKSEFGAHMAHKGQKLPKTPREIAKNRQKEHLDGRPPGIEPDVGVEPTTLRFQLLKSLTLYRLS